MDWRMARGLQRGAALLPSMCQKIPWAFYIYSFVPFVFNARDPYDACYGPSPGRRRSPHGLMTKSRGGSRRWTLSGQFEW